MIPLKTLLVGNSLLEFGVGFALLFAPDALTNPLNLPELRGVWEGGKAAVAIRPVFSCLAIATGLLTLLEKREYDKGKKVPYSILATLAFYHTIVCIPVLKYMGFSDARIPTFLSHFILAAGFTSHLFGEEGKREK